MTVSDEDPIEPAKSDAGTQNLPLGAFPTVDQKPVVTKADDVSAEPAVDGWSGGRCAKEDEFEQ